MTTEKRQKELKSLIEKLGLPANSPVDWGLLDLALTHSSADRKQNYEQLEFVGDAVVRLAASEVLLETYPNAPVGEFTAIRSVLVSDRSLAALGDNYGLDRYLKVAGGAVTDRNGRQSRLADAFEAVLGALYLSTHSMDLVRSWLDSVLLSHAKKVRQDPAFYNYKDALQEWSQGQYKIRPEYRVYETENNHNPTERFTAEVWLRDRYLGTGIGQSKKAAEQAAAKVAYLSVNSQVKTPTSGVVMGNG
ncbi:ribonuclease III [Spirulina sp. CS-785/01]|uniref:ribonuclease III n=1 Tax=Spirulina sp. CS-785/01 TaxID=3021716 RepID=UPI002330B7DB|nr:ribonuclease III [Spirulina sp. CS-785/01]MDB9312908.1 ribonuclease III [Spirulina sp. CS-785/01]